MVKDIATAAARLRFDSSKIKIKPSLYSRCYTKTYNQRRGLSPRLSVWATQLRRNVAAVANRWRHFADLTDPGFKLQTSRTDSVCAKQLSYRPVASISDPVKSDAVSLTTGNNALFLRSRLICPCAMPRRRATRHTFWRIIANIMKI